MQEVRAPVTGTILAIHVSEGQEVEPDQEVATIESMKMHIPVEVSRSGKVRQILAQEGEVVQEGSVLLVLDEE